MHKITPEDGALIARIQRGETSAFNELVRRHERRAYSYALRLTRNADEAADIVADAFVRVYRSLGTFRGDSSFTTWLYRIETNCFLDMKKKVSAQRTVSLEEILSTTNGQTDTQIADDRETPLEHVEKGERITVIQQVMRQLPKSHQAILMMYHAESMSYDEIADVLNMPIGTVKSRLNRARLRLRDALRPWYSLFPQIPSGFGNAAHA